MIIDFHLTLVLVATGDLSAIFPGMDQNFSKEIEDESNTYFQRIYNQPPGTAMSIDEVLDMLKKFKDATSKKERVMYTLLGVNFNPVVVLAQ